MNFVKSVKTFYENSGSDKLFLSVLPAFCAFICANNTFLFNFYNGILFLTAVIFLHISIKIFDDFIDWINENPQKRAELEQAGIRTLTSKCSHFINKSGSPRHYFYISLIFFILAILFLGAINIWLSVTVTILLVVSGLVNYHPKFYTIISKTSTELLISILCAPVNILFMFIACAKCIRLQIIYLSIIIFFLVISVCLIPSIINIKSDTITNKTTLPIILNNKKIMMCLLMLFITVPYILVAIGVYFNILPILSILTLALSGHSIWLFYLILLFEKEPQKTIKWNFLMGEDKYKTKNEQKNISWFTVRCNFARNIFVTFILLLIISLIDWSGTFIFPY